MLSNDVIAARGTTRGAYAKLRNVTLIRSDVASVFSQRGLVVPGTGWILADHTTIGDLADSLPEYHPYDCAVPSQHYKDLPAIWSYAEPHTTFGRLVRLEEMLQALANLIQATVGSN